MPRVRFSVTSRGTTTRGAADRLETKLRARVEATTDRLAGVVELIVPVAKGFMRDHVGRRIENDGMTGVVGWSAAVFNEAGLEFYPPHVEGGTRFAPAQPSLQPAFDEVAPEFRRGVEADVADVLRGGA